MITIIAVYDGTFEGLLSTIYDITKFKEEPVAILKKDNAQASLLHKTEEFLTDDLKFNAVLQRIARTFSSTSLKNIYGAFLSEKESIEMDIYKYIKLGIKEKKKIDFHMETDFVRNVIDSAGKVYFESHRFTGLIRFMELKDGTFYAAFEPDNNTLPVLWKHFAERYYDQKWVIHDKKRGFAAIHESYQEEVTFVEVIDSVQNIEDSYSENEEYFQGLWKTYFKHISIEERKNLKLQSQFMPKKYWGYLTEKSSLN